MAFKAIPGGTNLPIKGSYAWDIEQRCHVTVTPEFAQYMLQFNTRNRKLRGWHALELHDASVENQLMPLNLDLVYVRCVDRLILPNAQHVLKSVAMREDPDYMVDATLTVWGVDDWAGYSEVFANFDTKILKRGLSDFVRLVLLRLDYGTPVSYWCRIAKAIACYRYGFRYTDHQTAAERANLLIEYPGLRDRLWDRFFAEHRGCGDAEIRNKICRPSVMAAYLAGRKEVGCSKEAWDAFWDETVMGTMPMRRGSPGRAMRLGYADAVLGSGKPQKRGTYYMSNEQFYGTTQFMAAAHGSGKYNVPFTIVTPNKDVDKAA
jgi:hypothetical protein